jgi:Tol biopolymer transport system component
MTISRPSRLGSLCALTVLLLAAAAARAQDDRLALYSADLETGKVDLVTAEPMAGHAYCGSPDWSPDGKRILLDATPGKQWNKTNMLAVDFPVTEESRFTIYGPGNCPTWSPDGKRIAFLLNQDAVPGAQPGIYTMTAEGKDRRRLGGFGMPEWSPDGKRILAISFSSPTTLSLLEVATGKEQPIVLPDHTLHSVPGWAGDSQTLIAVVRGKGPLMIALLDISDPAASKVKEVLWSRGLGTDAEPLHPVYSVADKRCVFVGRTARGSALYMFDKAILTPQPLEKDRFDPRIASLDLSPDGKQLLFCAERLDSGKERVQKASKEPIPVARKPR